MTAQITPLHRARRTPYTPRPCLVANLGTGPQAPMAVDVPTVDLSPPPYWVARRRQMRRDAIMVLASAVMGVWLVYFAISPDLMIERAQVESMQ